ncbi:MAG: hypothetical protein A3J80_09040, partial [Desulfobacula sp. RIFOXYB2_FULL_45_6]
MEKNIPKQILLLLIMTTALVFTSIPCACFTNPEKPLSDDCITRFDTGTVNWTTGKVTAVGKASPAGKSRAAKESVSLFARADAVKNIIDALGQIKINNGLSVYEYAAEKNVILAGLEKTAREAIVSKQVYTSALAVEITIETSIFGGFLQLILPEEIRQIPKINPEINPKAVPEIGKSRYSGLIIDARGLGIEPVLDPVIISEQGHEIYSSAFISREFAVQRGVCKYVCNLDHAQRDERT